MARCQPDGRLAPGQLLHIAGPNDGGRRVYDVWESHPRHDTAFREKLERIMQVVGFPPPGSTGIFQVEHMLAKAV